MGRDGKFWASSVGKKVVMGASGIILVGFLIVHLAGNLQLFLGAERFNAYSKLLKHDVIELTWIVRLTLLASVILHTVSAYQLTMRNRAARPEAYAKRVPQVSTYASQVDALYLFLVGLTAFFAVLIAILVVTILAGIILHFLLAALPHLSLSFLLGEPSETEERITA